MNADQLQAIQKQLNFLQEKITELTELVSERILQIEDERQKKLSPCGHTDYREITNFGDSGFVYMCSVCDNQWTQPYKSEDD
jgi:hypothetical protein